MKGIITLLACLWAVSAGAANNYYVSDNLGNNSNNGLSTTAPFKTIQYAISQCAADDTINIMADTFSITSGIVINKPLMLRKHGSGRALLDAAAWNTSTPYKVIVTVDNAYDVTLEGLDFANCIGTGSKAIYAHGTCGDLLISNCTIRNIGWISNDLITPPVNVANDNAHAIHIVGDAGTALSYPIIRNCHISNCATGFSEAVTLTGYVTAALITRNTIDSISNIGIVLAGNYSYANPDTLINQCQLSTVSYNTVMHCMSAKKNASGIYLDGARQCTVENNKLFENAVGISVGAEQPTHGTVRANLNKIRNNEIVNCAVAGMVIGADAANNNYAENTIVNNNTLYKNRTGKHINGVTTINGQSSTDFANIHGGEIHLQNIDGLQLQNNIIHASDNKRNVVALDLYRIYNFNSDYNIYSRDDNSMSNVIGNGVLAFNNLTVSNISGYYNIGGGGGNKNPNTIGLDTNSMNTNPLFKQPSLLNLSLQANSPSVDKGNPNLILINPGVKDVQDSARIIGQGVDIGAYEYPFVVSVNNIPSNKIAATVYPNPATNEISISAVLEHPLSLSLVITDVSGRIVLATSEQQYNAGSISISTSIETIPSGIYIITLAGNSQPLWSGKLLKER